MPFSGSTSKQHIAMKIEVIRAEIFVSESQTIKSIKIAFVITASLNNSVTLGRIMKTKLSKYGGFSQIKWDLEKKMCTKRSLM